MMSLKALLQVVSGLQLSSIKGISNSNSCPNTLSLTFSGLKSIDK